MPTSTQTILSSENTDCIHTCTSERSSVAQGALASLTSLEESHLLLRDL